MLGSCHLTIMIVFHENTSAIYTFSAKVRKKNIGSLSKQGNQGVHSTDLGDVERSEEETT